ncbi:hypothetical protein IFU40_13620 [Microbacterium sp. CFBP 13617]|nr:hypothetical protein [Microbacterium sp. CFBP 13617]MBD8219672.1 hypothetical protein [Microbacterium sp. CFBP 13617]
MRQSIRQYIRGSINSAEGFANLMGGTGFSGRRRRAASARSARTSGS